MFGWVGGLAGWLAGQVRDYSMVIGCPLCVCVCAISMVTAKSNRMRYNTQYMRNVCVAHCSLFEREMFSSHVHLARFDDNMHFITSASLCVRACMCVCVCVLVHVCALLYERVCAEVYLLFVAKLCTVIRQFLRRLSVCRSRRISQNITYIYINYVFRELYTSPERCLSCEIRG